MLTKIGDYSVLLYHPETKICSMYIPTITQLSSVPIAHTHHPPVFKCTNCRIFKGVGQVGALQHYKNALHDDSLEDM